MLQAVAQSQQPERRRGQMTWLQVRRSASAQGRPADEVPSTQYRQVRRCTTLTRRGASIIAGEAGQLPLHHVMYHYSVYYGALPAGSGAARAQRRDRSAVARRRRCVTPARSVVFRRVEGRLCDPRSRAAATSQSGGHARLLIEQRKCSGKQRCLRIHLAVPRVDSPPRRSRAGALTSRRAWKKSREALIEHRRRSSSGCDITSGSGDEGRTPRSTKGKAE